MKRSLERWLALHVHKRHVVGCVRPLAGGGEVEELAAEFPTIALHRIVRHFDGSCTVAVVTRSGAMATAPFRQHG